MGKKKQTSLLIFRLWFEVIFFVSVINFLLEKNISIQINSYFFLNPPFIKGSLY